MFMLSVESRPPDEACINSPPLLQNALSSGKGPALWALIASHWDMQPQEVVGCIFAGPSDFWGGFVYPDFLKLLGTIKVLRYPEFFFPLGGGLMAHLQIWTPVCTYGP